MTRSGYAVSRPRTTRKWLAIFALLSFFLQSLAVQTHIHQQLPLTVAKTAAQGTPAPAPAKNQDPIEQCRLCQELLHAGTFVAPSVAISAINLTFVAASLTLLLAGATDPATGFAWQSRAPPVR